LAQASERESGKSPQEQKYRRKVLREMVGKKRIPKLLLFLKDPQPGLDNLGCNNGFYGTPPGWLNREHTVEVNSLQVSSKKKFWVDPTKELTTTTFRAQRSSKSTLERKALKREGDERTRAAAGHPCLHQPTQCALYHPCLVAAWDCCMCARVPLTVIFNPVLGCQRGSSPFFWRCFFLSL
jgi:hypothetical protein